MKVHKIVVPMTATSLLVTFIAYLFLPEDIPIIWNSKGNVLTMFKGIAFVTALFPFAAYLLRAIPLKINPKSDFYDKHQKAFETIILTLALIVAAIHWTLLYHSLGNNIGITFVTKLIVGIVIVIFGNFAGQVRQNIFTGFHSLWEYSGDNAWKRARKVGGYLIVGAGFFIAAAAFYSGYINAYVSTSVIAAAVLFNFIYSYLEYKEIKAESSMVEQ